MKTERLGYVDLSDPENPRVILNVKNGVKDDLRLRRDGQRVWVKIEDYSPKRSQEQNSFLHVWLQEIADETGHERDWLKGYFADKWLRVPKLNAAGEEMPDPETGEVLTRVRSTTELSKLEFSEYMDRIRLFCIEFFNFVLPDAEKDREIKFK